MIDHMISKFRNLWTPHREISINEQMIGTRCRIGFIQYMPAKPVKFAVKNWVLADSVYPYVCNFQIYTGRDGWTPEHGLAKTCGDGFTGSIPGQKGIDSMSITFTALLIYSKSCLRGTPLLVVQSDKIGRVCQTNSRLRTRKLIRKASPHSSSTTILPS